MGFGYSEEFDPENLPEQIWWVNKKENLYIGYEIEENWEDEECIVYESYVPEIKKDTNFTYEIHNFPQGFDPPFFLKLKIVARKENVLSNGMIK